jgi:putative transposase
MARAPLPAAAQALERFAERGDAKYPAISPCGLADWDRLPVLFDYPPGNRRVISTTKAIESLNFPLRKRLKTHGAFLNEESMVKVVYLALQHVAKMIHWVTRRVASFIVYSIVPHTPHRRSWYAR